MNARGLGLGGVLFVGKKSHIRGVYGYLYKYVIALAIVIGFVYNPNNEGKGVVFPVYPLIIFINILMRLNKKSFWKSLYKISIVLFLVGYNFAPPVLAIEQLSNINKETPDQSVLVTTEEDSDVLNEVPIDDSEDILPEGISDPEGIAKGVETVSRIMSRGFMPMAGGTGEYTIASTSGKWTSTSNNSIVNNINTSHITWPKSGDKSGLSFTGVSGFSFDEGEEFDLGVLKHFNYPVSSAITRATLSVDINISNPSIGTKTFTFEMLIDETNNVSPCPWWHTDGHPVCDDKITFPTSYSKQTFDMGGKKYTLEITGFINAAGKKVNEFITEEKKTNEATLVGKLTSVDSQVEICHATTDQTNPYEKKTVAATSTVDGHNSHNGNAWYPGITGTWGDIIPRFLYFDGSGNIKEYVGKNNNDYGLSLLANNCELPTGEIEVQKITIPSGNNTSFEVTGTGVASISNSPVTFVDGNKGNISEAQSKTFKVYPGKYSFTETPAEGWIETDNDCEDIVIANKGKETCTITNTKASSIKIVKHSEQPDGTSFKFKTAGDGLSDFSLVDNSVTEDPIKVFSNLLPGNYSITEDLEGMSDWYLKNVTCDNQQEPNNLVLTAGDNVTCTFTNTQYGKLIFKKHANPASTQEFSFDVTGNGVEDFILVDNSATEDPIKEFSNLLPGTYTISEKDVNGWYQEGVSCTSNLNHNEVITGLKLDAGETITCTFTNTKYGSISGYKYKDANGIIDEPNTDISVVPNWTIFIDENKNGVKDTGEKTVQTTPEGKYKFDKLEPGTYWITEVITAGWMNLTLKTQVITIGAGEDRENVNFINVKQGSITVNKNVDKDGDGDIDITGSTDWTWTLNNETGHATGSTVSSLNPGTYTIKEVNQDNYHFESLECIGSDGINISNETATINLKSGEDVVCTYTNARNLGTLIVKKVVVNDNGGTLKPEDFNFTIDGGDSIQFESDGENTFMKYAGLSYKIAEVEANQRGYTTTYDNCDVEVKYGETATCTITNNDNEVSLQLVKEVVKNNGGTADPKDWTLSADGPTPLTGAGGVTSGDEFEAGTYTLSESGDVEGYSAGDWSCTNNIAINENNEITLGLGQSTVCTIINDDIAPSLTLVKDVKNTYGGDAKTTDWNLKAEGPTTISGDGGVTSGSDFKAGAYTLSESGDVAGYSADDWSCTGGIIPDANNGITLGLGQSTTCTIINKDLPAKLKVIKHVINGVNDGTKSASDFTMNVAGTKVSNTSFSGSEDGVTVTLNQGSFKVTEVEDTENYKAGYEGCEGTINVGEEKTCTITNTAIDHKPTIKVTKVADKTSVKETGEDVIFTFTVTNTSKVDTVEITSLIDSVFGDLNGEHNCKVGTKLEVTGTCSFEITRTLSSDDITKIHHNVFTVEAIDDEKNKTSGTDEETVTFYNVDPTVDIEKTATTSTLPEPGGDFEFTLKITNTSDEPVKIVSLVDSNILALPTDCSALLNTWLDPKGSVSCQYTIKHVDAGSYDNTATVTVEDNEGEEATDTDTETVTVTDVLPEVSLTKTVTPDTLPEPGGVFTYTLTIKNESVEKLQITSLTDSYTLSQDCTDLIGLWLNVGESKSCQYTITHTNAGKYKNTATVKGKDNEGNEVSSTDDATITITDVDPTVELVKSVSPLTMAEPGGIFTYTLKITNTSEEDITITNLTDTYTLSDSCNALKGTTLTPNQIVTCTYPVTHTDAGIYNNTATVTASDDENNSVEKEATAKAIVVGARIKFTELNATNNVNEPHTFTILAEENDGTGWVPAVGEDILFSLINTPTGASIVGSHECITDSEGKCDITINSTVPGNVTIQASGVIGILTHDIEIKTDGQLGSSTNAVKTYLGSRVTIEKQTNPNRRTDVFTFAPSWTETFTLQDDGKYTSDWLKPGQYRVSEGLLQGWEYGTIVCNDANSGGSNGVLTINLEAGEDIKCTFNNILKKGSISGVKFHDRNGNGVRDEGEEGLAGWVIYIDENNNGKLDRRIFGIPTEQYTVSGANGSWSFNNLSDGNYTIREDNSDNGSWYQSSVNPPTIKIEYGRDFTGITFGNTMYGSVIGAKFNDLNGNGRYDIGEQTIKNWKITIEGENNYNKEVKTDGAFGVYGYQSGKLKAGTYTVTEETKEGWTATSPDSKTIVINSGDIKTVDFYNFKDVVINVTKDVIDINGKDTSDDTSFDVTLNRSDQRTISEGSRATYTLTEAGKYTVTELLNDNYESLGCKLGRREATNFTVTSGGTYNIVCTNKQKPGTIIVKKDVVKGNDKSVQTNDIFNILFSTEEIKEISDSKEESKVAEFNSLNPGTYSFTEEAKDGYLFKGCYVEGDETQTLEPEISLASNQEVTYICENEVIDPLLQIEKSNDKQDKDQYAGDEVTYTITVTAPEREGEDVNGKYVLNNVTVSDIAPAGFAYISGTWTAKKKDGTVIEVKEPTYDGKNPAKWGIGDMVEGDVIILTYRTKISLLQEPGTYPDIAWVKGDSLADETVLGVSATDSDTHFVGTDVTVIEGDETEEGEVLGATTTLELPKTGASAYLILGALLMMILGTLTLLFKPFKKFKKAILTTTLTILMFAIPSVVKAANIKVDIMTPPAITNKSTIKIGFVALDISGEDISVQCYKNGEEMGAPIAASSGECVATDLTTGTYTFYVIAKSTSGEETSKVVTVVVNLEKPSPVIDYSKTGNILKFKTADDGKTVKVEIHRSEKPSYTANASTKIHEMTVSPNTEQSWTDTTAEAGKTYYYALRTVDAQGNISTFVSDPEVVPVVPTTTGSVDSSTSPTGEVKESEVDGEVAGEEDTAKNGDTDGEDKEEEKEGEEEVKEGAKSFLQKWYIWLPIILVIGGIIFYVRKQRKD